LIRNCFSITILIAIEKIQAGSGKNYTGINCVVTYALPLMRGNITIPGMIGLAQRFETKSEPDKINN
jgi:hypothetical protein